MKLTLAKYQALDAIISDKNLSEIDKTLYSICAIYDYAPEQLDKENPLKVIRMSRRIEKIFKFKIKAPTWIGIYKMNYDINSITFGQYIELSFFFSKDIITNSHFIAASCSEPPFKKAKHSRKARYFLKSSVSKVVGAMQRIKQRFESLNKEFSGLFGLDDEINEQATEDPFMQAFNARYGWQFTAETVAGYERITMEETYNLPARQALNDLMYLKQKQKYVFLLNKR